VSLPSLPVAFPELDACTLDAMRKITRDHLDLQAFCAKLKYMQDLKAIQTKSLDENFAVASERTRICEAQLTGLCTAVAALEEDLRRKVQAFQALEREQQEILKPTPVRDVQRKLVVAKKQAFDESEAIADRWTGSQNTDAFLTEFLAARKVHHLRAAKLELLDSNSSSSSPSSSYR
jgi:Modifier of rudimentary (Mod(r)) protein